MKTKKIQQEIVTPVGNRTTGQGFKVQHAPSTSVHAQEESIELDYTRIPNSQYYKHITSFYFTHI